MPDEGTPNENQERWRRETLEPVTRRFPERREQFLTDSGIPIEPIYTPANGDASLEDIGFPGEYPYTRGVQPNMYRGRVWTMRQYSGYATAADTNRRYRYLLEQGQTGLSVAFDLPTQIGYDSDAPQSRGEVGKVGVPICSLEDMETLFEEIPLDRVSTSMTINATASVLLCLYIAAARRQGVSPEQLSGTLQNDILKEYIARGTYAYPPRPSMRLVVDVFKYCAENIPRWNTISISGYHMREAGATAVQELAFTFSNAIAYVQAAVDAGSGGGRLRPAPVLLLRGPEQPAGRGGQVPGRPPHVGHHYERPFRRQRPPFPDAAVPYPDCRGNPHRPAARQ